MQEFGVCYALVEFEDTVHVQNVVKVCTDTHTLTQELQCNLCLFVLAIHQGFALAILCLFVFFV